MQPATPIIPGVELDETVIAKNQPPYLPLVAHIMDDGTVLIRWRLSWRERITILFTGNLWHFVSAFHQPLQPIALTTQKPRTTENV